MFFLQTIINRIKNEKGQLLVYFLIMIQSALSSAVENASYIYYGIVNSLLYFSSVARRAFMRLPANRSLYGNAPYFFILKAN